MASRNKIFLGTFVHSKSRTELEYLHDAAMCVDGSSGTIVHIERDFGSDHSPASIERLVSQLGPSWASSSPSESGGGGGGGGDDGNSSHHRDGYDVVATEQGQFFFPGFVDTHIHAAQYPNAGLFGKTTLLDWLEEYTFPLEASLASDLPKAKRVYTTAVRRTLRNGTTTAAYYATIDVAATNLLADVCLSLGQRALVGRVCMDERTVCPAYYRDESAEESLRRTVETVEHCARVDPTGRMVGPILTPRFAPSCSVESMRGLAALQRSRDLPVQTHVSENRGEISLVKKMFAGLEGATLEGDEDGGVSYPGVYDAVGLLTGRTILAHGVYLTEREAALVSARGSKVAHCPCSNSALASGSARVRWLWQHGIDVGLGTDVSGGYSASILEAARQAALVSRVVAVAEAERRAGGEAETSKLTAQEVLYLATRGGAVVVGMEDRLGGFEVGMQWDAQLVGLGMVKEEEEEEEDGEDDDGNCDVFGWESWGERLEKWLYTGDDRNTKMVWVGGRLVHERRVKGRRSGCM
ncbi:guanine deaminase [Geosmithia morbida]|uniref:Guanine deaminase n=1 Tax=Geosmithia morbida TaxID=1094350 RepID=A0A9P5D878_9HYPO|nr:guanine deaminase [Geosmithia morbida]KAF4125254.1 guanine deaminase [Geosmithia morbida]